MGRGNVCTHNECEGLYYLDRDLLDMYYKVTRRSLSRGRIEMINDGEAPMTARQLDAAGIEYSYDGSIGGWAYDHLSSDKNWKHMVDFVTEAFLKHFKSFSETDHFKRGQHIVLQNKFFEIAVVDNEWSVAWCLLEREDVDDKTSKRALMRRHYERYLEDIKRILIEGWGEAVGYGGAWAPGKTYGRILHD